MSKFKTFKQPADRWKATADGGICRRILFIGLMWGMCLPFPGPGFGAEPPLAEDYSGAPSYRLGPGDILKISVWKDEHLTGDVTVLNDGFVSFPLVGPVRAAGKTLDQFMDDLKAKLKHYVPDPALSVIVTEARSLKIYVIGKVNRPGEFTVGHPIDVMQALSLAGGVTPYASSSNIKVLRRLGDRQVVFPFDYGDAIKGHGLERNIILERWDVVMVP